MADSQPPQLYSPQRQIDLLEEALSASLPLDAPVYLISAQWVSALTSFLEALAVKARNSPQAPGPLDSSSLLDIDNSTANGAQEPLLRPGLVERRDYRLINQAAFEHLKTQYGASHYPAVQRPTHRGPDGMAFAEIYIPQLRLYRCLNPKQAQNEPRPASASSSSTLSAHLEHNVPCMAVPAEMPFSTLLRKVRLRIGGVDIDLQNMRIWKAHNGQRSELVTEAEQSMPAGRWLNGLNGLCVEVRAADEDWPTDMPDFEEQEAEAQAQTDQPVNSSSGESSSTPRRIVPTQQYAARETVRGVIGLMNLGNTCFMNSALQCLSNAAPLTRYFLLGLHRNSLNVQNPLGLSGRAALGYGRLLDQIWSSPGPTSAVIPREVKGLMGQRNAVFLGYAQQDAQELVGTLLDVLHEDLNRIASKPYIEREDWDGAPAAADVNLLGPDSAEWHNAVRTRELAVATRAWRDYRARDSSIISDLFVGLFRSELVCPNCRGHSVVFEPYNILQVPIPGIRISVRWVIWVEPWRQSGWDRSRKPWKTLRIEVLKQGSTVGDWKKAVAAQVSVATSEIAMTEYFQDKLHKVFVDDTEEAEIGENDRIILYQIPPLEAETRALAAGTKRPLPHFADESPAPRHRLVFIQLRTAKLYGFESTRAVAVPVLVNLPQQCSHAELITTIENVIDVWAGGAETLADARKEAVEQAELEMETRIADAKAAAAAKARSAEAARTRAVVDAVMARKSPEHNIPRVKPVAAAAFFGGPAAIPQPVYGTAQPINEWPPPVAATPDPKSRSHASSTQIEALGMPSPTIEGQIEEKTSPTSESPTLSESSNDIQPPAPWQLPLPYKLPGLGRKESYTFDANLSRSSCVEVVLPNTWTGVNLIDAETKAAEAECAEGRRSDAHAASERIVSVEDCLQEFMREEELSQENSWYCPKCKEHKQATKKVELWSIPEIAVVHLKRFSQNGYHRDKIETQVDFPVDTYLDLGEFMRGPLEGPEDLMKPSKIVDGHEQMISEGQANTMLLEVDVSDLHQERGLYELFGVSNHLGGLGGGHYFAYAKNPISQQWYNFNDASVRPMDAQDVVTPGAYILFYRRRVAAGPLARNADGSCDMRVTQSPEEIPDPVPAPAPPAVPIPTSLPLSLPPPSQSAFYTTSQAGTYGAPASPAATPPRQFTPDGVFSDDNISPIISAALPDDVAMDGLVLGSATNHQTLSLVDPEYTHSWQSQQDTEEVNGLQYDDVDVNEDARGAAMDADDDGNVDDDDMNVSSDDEVRDGSRAVAKAAPEDQIAQLAPRAISSGRSVREGPAR